MGELLMTNNKIKVSVLYPWGQTSEEFIKLLDIADLPIAERIVVDNENPDYLLASDKIYSVKEYEAPFRKLIENQKDSSPIRIAFFREALAPDLNIFDYAVCWNWNLSYGDRVARIPPHYLIGDNYTVMPAVTNDFTYDEARKSLQQGKKRFCNFLYTNQYAHPIRDKIFYEISNYKKVDSLGAHLNNIGTLIGGGRRVDNWGEMSIRIKSNYKFTIACENCSYDGYVSEKLLTSFNAHTVPIYWGNPYIAEEYNPEAFINVRDYDSLDSLVKRIKEIDENDDLWAHIVSQPWQTEEQKNYSDSEYQNYKNFILNIFSQPLEKARRRPYGGFSDIDYKYWFLHRRLIHSTNFVSRVSQAIINPDRVAFRIHEAMLPKTDIDEFFKN